MASEESGVIFIKEIIMQAILAGACNGIDVSSWEDDPTTPRKIYWNVAKAAGANFIIDRATINLTVDNTFVEFMQTCKALKSTRGSYMFANYTMDITKQITHYVNLLQNKLTGYSVTDQTEIPPIIDLEENIKMMGKYPDAGTLRNFAFSGLRLLLKQSGCKKVGLYTNPDTLKILMTDPVTLKPTLPFPQDIMDTTFLWLAQYLFIPRENAAWSCKPYPAPTFVQYSDNGDGRAFGCETDSVDLNFAVGGLLGLTKFLESVGAPAPIAEDPTPVLTLDQRVTSLETRVTALEAK
jgi:Glycosyl hydrolases family 25